MVACTTEMPLTIELVKAQLKYAIFDAILYATSYTISYAISYTIPLPGSRASLFRPPPAAPPEHRRLQLSPMMYFEGDTSRLFDLAHLWDLCTLGNHWCCTSRWPHIWILAKCDVACDIASLRYLSDISCNIFFIACNIACDIVYDNFQAGMIPDPDRELSGLFSS